MTRKLSQISDIKASQHDKEDPLRSYRDKFHLPVNPIGQPLNYLCGNSLGLQPVSTIEFVEHELRQWREIGVEGHFSGSHPWMPYHEFVADSMAAVMGGLPTEVVAMNGLTVNLHLMLVSFFRPVEGRTRVVMESNAFPSDRYAVASQLRFRGLDVAENLVELEPRDGEHTLRTSDIIDFLDSEGDKVALVLLAGVNYYTGQLFDMASITEAGHRNGCMVGFDLAHAAGNVPLSLHEWDVDFAVWCTYKYLNAGPGSVAGAFVHERHLAERSLPRFEGWWGHNRGTRFDMPSTFEPAPTVEAWQLSNSPILSLASLRASLEIFDAVGMGPIREKSIKLTRFLEEKLLELEGRSFEIITPSNPDARGAQLSLLFERDAEGVHEALRRQDVVCDYRKPDVVRIAPVPLYNSFKDAQGFVRALEGCLTDS